MDLGVGSFGAGELPHAHRHRPERSSGRPVHLYVLLFIYLAASVLVVAYGIWFPDQDGTQALCIGVMES